VLRIPTRVGPSRIHGLGLFATEDVPRGTVVWRLDAGFDLEVDEVAAAALPPTARDQLDRYAYADPARGVRILCADDARFFNHADAANCGDSPEEGPDVTVALRDVAAGEELTWDYRESGSSPPG
jgi:SET domain-containing protein